LEEDPDSSRANSWGGGRYLSLTGQNRTFKGAIVTMQESGLDTAQVGWFFARPAGILLAAVSSPFEPIQTLDASSKVRHVGRV
jgi:hypothetical protein